MSFGSWLLLFIVFTVVILLAVGIGLLIRNRIHPDNTPPVTFVPPLVFSKPVQGPNPLKNTCQLYQFGTSAIGGIVTPSNVTYNSSVLDKLQGSPNYPTCLDSDQIIARQVVHTCTGPSGVTDGAITRCKLIDGTTTGLGGKETYYTNVGCYDISPCLGELAVISVNYHAPQIPSTYCMRKTGNTAGSSIVMAPCDIADETQLFRITRLYPGQSPAALVPGMSQNGPITKIFDRDSQLCVVPSPSLISTQVNYGYTSSIPCKNNNVGVVQGNPLVLGPCTGNYGGYVWGLFPSTVIGSGTLTTVTPPQIGYLDGIIPTVTGTTGTGPTGQFSSVDPSLLFSQFLAAGGKTLFYGAVDNKVVLSTTATDVTSCLGLASSAQYLNFDTYNVLTKIESCIANKTVGTSGCLNL